MFGVCGDPVQGLCDHVLVERAGEAFCFVAANQCLRLAVSSYRSQEQDGPGGERQRDFQRARDAARAGEVDVDDLVPLEYSIERLTCAVARSR